MPSNKCKPLPIPTEVDIQRFRSKIEVHGPDECWPWIAGRDIKGYGNFHLLGQNVQSHRLAFMLERKYDPQPLHVLHRCDNPPCVNPKHLFLGTTQDNTADRHSKGRDASGERSGAKLHPERWWQRGEFHRRPGAKITEAQVREIRQLCERGIHRDIIASRFEISTSNVAMIVNGRTWKHIPLLGIPPARKGRPVGSTHPYPNNLLRGEQIDSSKLTAEQVTEIRTSYAQGGVTMAILGAKYGVLAPAICRIIHRQTWRHID